MRKRDLAQAADLLANLNQYEQGYGPLVGLNTLQRRNSFVEQLLDSIRRIKFVQAIQERDIAATRAEPDNPKFDPIRAAVLHRRGGNYDEACWLVFLAIHCGRHRRQGWKLVSDLCKGDSAFPPWTWVRVTADVKSFRNWLEEKNEEWKVAGTRGSFGNHRRRESLSGWSANGTGAVFASYCEWIGNTGSHEARFLNVTAAANGDREKAFSLLYDSMSAVHRFGRLGKFDYLCMLGKLGIVDIEPGSPFLAGSSGPLKGAKRVVGGNMATDKLDACMTTLARTLGVNMQVMEDALCNWQKSPDVYRPFRG